MSHLLPLPKYRDVRLQSWGKWARIRNPDAAARVWLGMFATTKEVAHACVDVAALCFFERRVKLKILANAATVSRYLASRAKEKEYRSIERTNVAFVVALLEEDPLILTENCMFFEFMENTSDRECRKITQLEAEREEMFEELIDKDEEEEKDNLMP